MFFSFRELYVDGKNFMVLFCFFFPRAAGGPAVGVILQAILRVHRSAASNKGRKDSVRVFRRSGRVSEMSNAFGPGRLALLAAPRRNHANQADIAKRPGTEPATASRHQVSDFLPIA